MPNTQLPPHPLLAGYVKCIWLRERDFQPPHDTFEVYPDSYVELVFSFGAPCRISDAHGTRPLPPAYIVGLLGKPFRLHAQGLLTTIGVRLFAWGFCPLFGVAVGQLPQSVRHLDETMRQLAEHLAGLVAGGDTQAALAYLHAFLVERALGMTLPQPAAHAAAQALVAQGGAGRIAELAAAVKLSPRQLERKFNTAVGVSPKAMARMLRFEHVRDYLSQYPQADLAALAYDYGYADQAHFNRDFKRFSNRTPRQFAAEMATLHDLMRGSGVAFVQDP